MNPICHGLLEGMQVFFRASVVMDLLHGYVQKKSYSRLPTSLQFGISQKNYFFLAKSDKLRQ